MGPTDDGPTSMPTPNRVVLVTTASRVVAARSRADGIACQDRLSSGRMIHGAHVILYSTDSDADRAFFRDVLAYPSVDAGGGWLIFALPPAEIAVHPSDKNDVHELYFMCDDVKAFIEEMRAKNVACSPVDEQRWGA